MFPNYGIFLFANTKSKMATKIQDGGQKFGVLSTGIFSLANIYHHAKKLDLRPNV